LAPRSRLRRLLNPESRDHQELTVALPPDRAMEACLGAVEDLGWAAKRGEDKGRLTVMEDFTKLHCGDSPLRIEIQVRPDNGGSSSKVEVEAVLPGTGGVTNKHLSEGSMVFALYIGRNAKALGG
jgi:hypothetical protein